MLGVPHAPFPLPYDDKNPSPLPRESIEVRTIVVIWEDECHWAKELDDKALIFSATTTKGRVRFRPYCIYQVEWWWWSEENLSRCRVFNRSSCFRIADKGRDVGKNSSWTSSSNVRQVIPWIKRQPYLALQHEDTEIAWRQCRQYKLISQNWEEHLKMMLYCWL